MRSEGFYVNEKSTDTKWDRTSDLMICSTVLQQRPNFIYTFSKTATFSLSNINSLAFITEMESVYSTVRTASLNETDYVPSFKGKVAFINKH